MFYKLDTTNGNIVKFVTSKASPRIFGSSVETCMIIFDSNF
jgi:hypothetical protein